jgi:hypothetical protein
VLLERLPIFVIRGVFNGDGVITFADFAVFLCFALPLLRYIFKSRRGSQIGDILGDVILQTTTCVSATTPGLLVLKARSHVYSPCSVDATRST